MKILSFFSHPNLTWDIDKFPKPWNVKRTAIYVFLKGDTKPEEDKLLPDDEIFNDKREIKCVSGAEDGNYVRHGYMPTKEKKDVAKEIYSALEKLVKNPIEEHISVFYRLLLENNTIDFIDELISLIALNSSKLDFERIQKLARWLAKASPDRRPVKTAIAILGVFPGSQNKKLFMVLGSHEEFALYSAVALGNSLEYPELELWELAKQLNGWGKIEVVERLAKTKNEVIKQWMLREGYKNSVMYEYLVHLCAVTGELLPALKSSKVDDALLSGAGDITEALILGGPAKDMHDYDDGAEVTWRYIEHIEDKILSFRQFLIIKTIHDFVEDDAKDWELIKKKGWTEEIRKNIARKASTILNKPEWKEKAISILESEVHSDKNTQLFYKAARVAEVLGVDTWDYYYKRQKSGQGSEWFYLMQTKDSAQIDKVIALAEEIIPLDKVATGPGIELFATGPGSDLDFIVQDLHRFPGKGWNLIKTALRSPSRRNRNCSLYALEKWGRKNWPEEAEQILQEALKNEPDTKIRKTIKKLIEKTVKDKKESQ